MSVFKKMLEHFSEDNYAETVRQLNTGLYALSFDDNFDAKTVELSEIEAGKEFTMNHALKRAVKGRIITYQTGGGTVLDVKSDETTATLKNTGSDKITKIRILFF